uniref:Uncharacterized protein n=1 Tax=Oryza glumipatula TaxID=40148 RepID=A0A0D9YMH5_9ORYZ
MASDGLGGAVPRSNPVTTVVLRPDPVVAGVPRLTSDGSTGGGGRKAALQECSEFVEFSAPQLTIMGEAATPARQEDVVQFIGWSFLLGGAFACHGKASKMG